MKLEQRNYTRPGGKHISICVDGRTVAFVEQNMHIDNPKVWDTPYIFVNHEKVTELEQLDLMKDALCMAGELFEEWSEDTGKEIVEG